MKKEKKIHRETYTFDASKYVLGRLASKIALILQGKHKPDFVPYLDKGDKVEVINIDKIKITGKKLDNKIYFTKLDKTSNAHRYAFLMREDKKNKMKTYVKITLEDFEKWLKR